MLNWIKKFQRPKNNLKHHKTLIYKSKIYASVPKHNNCVHKINYKRYYNN